MNWTETETVVTICTGIVTLTQFLLWRYIARSKFYESEKGKNLATKEDIEDITQKIESIKESYNKSLEVHKIELLKDFESHKYIQSLCHTLDNKLLSLVSTCLNADASNVIDEQTDDDKLISNTYKLSNFLNTHKSRYESCPTIKDLTDISSSIKSRSDVRGLHIAYQDENGDIHYKLSQEDKDLLISLLNKTMLLFLPPLNIKHNNTISKNE